MHPVLQATSKFAWLFDAITGYWIVNNEISNIVLIIICCNKTKKINKATNFSAIFRILILMYVYRSKLKDTRWMYVTIKEKNICEPRPGKRCQGRGDAGEKPRHRRAVVRRELHHSNEILCLNPLHRFEICCVLQFNSFIYRPIRFSCTDQWNLM